MQKKISFTGLLLSNAKRFFHSRNIIIISEHKVDHVPLSGVMQLLVFLGFLGFFSGTSYITGSYMAARNVIQEKDKKLVTTTIEKKQISQEIGVLKRDLQRLSENGNELDAYSKFIINQHNDILSKNGSVAITTPKPINDGNLFGQNTGQLLDRISFLETRVNEIKNENEHLVAAIRERTDNKISYLDDIISMTGLKTERLERLHAAEKEADKKNTHLAAPDESAKKDPGIRSDNEGGPFIPYNDTFLNSTEHAVVADIDRLVLLDEIVKHLPLAQPLAQLQQISSPFGKRLDPFNRRWSVHPGIDLRGPNNSRVLATNDGIVIAAEKRPAYGNMVDIEHKYGIVTRYAHLSKILVQEGQKINKGQAIGIQGSTGRSTGEHLHYEVRINDHPVNPINFLNAGEYVLQN
jgi:murein DD-endopeptidase MepM/ murein hydrolase activator NlpD